MAPAKYPLTVVTLAFKSADGREFIRSCICLLGCCDKSGSKRAVIVVWLKSALCFVSCFSKCDFVKVVWIYAILNPAMYWGKYLSKIINQNWRCSYLLIVATAHWLSQGAGL